MKNVVTIYNSDTITNIKASMSCHVLHLDKILSHLVETDTTIAFGKHDKHDILSALSHAHGHLDVMFTVKPKGNKYAVKWHTAQFKDESHDASEMSWWKAMLLMYRHNITCKVTTKQWDMTHAVNESSHTRQGRARHIRQKPLGIFNTIKHYKAKMGDPFDTFMRHKCAQISFYLDLPMFKKLLGLKCTLTWDHHSVGEHVIITFHGSSQGDAAVSADKMRSGMVRYIRSPKGLLTKHNKSCRDVVTESNAVDTETQETQEANQEAAQNVPTQSDNNSKATNSKTNNKSNNKTNNKTNNNSKAANNKTNNKILNKPVLHRSKSMNNATRRTNTQPQHLQSHASAPGHWSPTDRSGSTGIAGASFWSAHTKAANVSSQRLAETNRQLSQKVREAQELIRTGKVDDQELHSLVRGKQSNSGTQRPSKIGILRDAVHSFKRALTK